MTLSQIMNTAHSIRRYYRGAVSMSVAMKMAWGLARGFTYAVEAAFVDWDLKVVRRDVFLGNNYDEANAAKNVAVRKRRDEGLRIITAMGTNLKLYAPVEEAVAHVEPLPRAA